MIKSLIVLARIVSLHLGDGSLHLVRCQILVGLRQELVGFFLCQVYLVRIGYQFAGFRGNHLFIDMVFIFRIRRQIIRMIGIDTVFRDIEIAESQIEDTWGIFHETAHHAEVVGQTSEGCTVIL